MQDKLLTDDLDPTTARLASELAASLLPSLTKSLLAAVPSADFAGSLERSNRLAQDLRSQIEKVIRSDIDENRAGRSVIMQSIGNILEDISAVKRTVEKLPANLEKSKPNPEALNINTKALEAKLDSITGLLDEIIHGMKSFGEAYAEDKEQHTPLVTQQIYSGSDSQLEKLLTESLPNLEGLLRANAKSQSKELEGFSQELSALHEQNNIALIHEVKEGVSEELSHYTENMLSKLNEAHESESAKLAKLFKILLIMSGTSIFLTVIMIVMMILK